MHLRIVREAAAREGRDEGEYFREAFRIAALRAQRWSGGWDIPALSFGGPLTNDEVRAGVEEPADHRAYDRPSCTPEPLDADETRSDAEQKA